MADGHSPLFSTFGRQPPANQQAEQGLLGALLTSNRGIDQCDGLLPEHFQDPVNGRIFASIKARIESGRVADVVTLHSIFLNSGTLQDVGGSEYLASLLTAMASPRMTGEYSLLIREAATRRTLIEVSTELLDRAYGADPDDTAASIISDAHAAIDEATPSLGRATGTLLGDASQTALEKAEAVQRGETKSDALRTGIATLDALWRNIRPGTLHMIGARPSTGKTAFAAQIMRNVSKDMGADRVPGQIAMFSLEMDREQFARANLQSMTGIGQSDIADGKFTDKQAEQLVLARRELASYPITIFDQPGMPLDAILSTARALHRKSPIRLLAIDHRDLMPRDRSFDRRNTNEWTSHITGALKSEAKRLECAIFLLVQLSRANEKREDHRPISSDLMQSGEADADNIALLYRPSMHIGDLPPRKIRETDEQYDAARRGWWKLHDAMEGIAEVIMPKARSDKTGTAKLRFDGPHMLFSDPVQENVDDPDLWREQV